MKYKFLLPLTKSETKLFTKVTATWHTVVWYVKHDQRVESTYVLYCCCYWYLAKTSTNASTDRVEREKGAEEFP